MLANYKTITFTLLGLSAAVLSSEAIVMDLNDTNYVSPNEIVTNQFASVGLNLSVYVAAYSSTPSLQNAVIFDTGNPANNDDEPTSISNGVGDKDMVNYGEAGSITRWQGGNLQHNLSVSQNVLILQENNTGTYTGAPVGFINAGFADDVASNGSYFLLEFSNGIDEFQVDWMDSDDGGGYSFTFTGRNASDEAVSVDISFLSFTTTDTATGSTLYDASIIEGDHFANRLPKLTLANIEEATGEAFAVIDSVQINMKGSGGFANVEYAEVVPEPSSYALIFGSVMFALASVRRRR